MNDYAQIIMDTFPELWDAEGERLCGKGTWTGFGDIIGIKIKDNDYDDLKKRIYFYLKNHPEIVSFLIL